MKIIPISAEFIVKYRAPFQTTAIDCCLIWSNPTVLDFLPEWAFADLQKGKTLHSADFLESLFPHLVKAPSLHHLFRASAHIDAGEEKVEVDFSSPSNWTFYYKGFSGIGESPAAALKKRSEELDRVNSLTASIGFRVHPIPDYFEEVISFLNTSDMLSRRVKNLLEVAEKLPHIFGSSDERNV